ncbi:hypothetical protein Droror1_Dr00027796 [Drosera rotundifolia]
MIRNSQPKTVASVRPSLLAASRLLSLWLPSLPTARISVFWVRGRGRVVVEEEPDEVAAESPKNPCGCCASCLRAQDWAVGFREKLEFGLLDAPLKDWAAQMWIGPLVPKSNLIL